LAINEHVQSKEPKPLAFELEDFELVEFESISNHLTLGNIKGTNVPIHYYHDVPVQNNNATISMIKTTCLLRHLLMSTF
jgi:hypothetical protein